MDANIFVYNNLYLYVFGGWNNYYKTSNNKNNNYVDKIEKLKIFQNSENFSIVNSNKWEIIQVFDTKNDIRLSELLKKCSMGIIPISVDKFYLVGGDTSEYNSETFNDCNSSGIGANKLKYHSSIVEIKINCIGGCEAEIKKFCLEKPCSFNITKSFLLLNNNEYGCFNNLHELYLIKTILNDKEMMFENKILN